MAPTYETEFGEEIVADSATGVVDRLREVSRDPGASRIDFMRRMAVRVAEFHGHFISVETADEFVDGLLSAGLLKRKS